MASKPKSDAGAAPAETAPAETAPDESAPADGPTVETVPAPEAAAAPAALTAARILYTTPPLDGVVYHPDQVVLLDAAGVAYFEATGCIDTAPAAVDYARAQGAVDIDHAALASPATA